MHKNVLILGGYNWFGYEIIDTLICENSFNHFIIVDNFSNQLWKDNIKSKMDKYRYLYDVDIFLYNNDIKDQIKLNQIYEKHNITHVVNNIKYNIKDEYIMEKLDGFKNVYECNVLYGIQYYICFYRYITHNSFCFNHDINTDYVYMSNTFNHLAKTIYRDSSSLYIEEINLKDYVYGEKKDKYNEIISKYKRIIRCNSYCHIYDKSFYIQRDVDILQRVYNILLNVNSTTVVPCHQYSYKRLVDMIKDQLNPSSTIIDEDNTYILNYINICK